MNYNWLQVTGYGLRVWSPGSLIGMYRGAGCGFLISVLQSDVALSLLTSSGQAIVEGKTIYQKPATRNPQPVTFNSITSFDIPINQLNHTNQ